MNNKFHNQRFEPKFITTIAINQIIEFVSGKKTLKGKVYEIGVNSANVTTNNKKYFIKYKYGSWFLINQL